MFAKIKRSIFLTAKVLAPKHSRRRKWLKKIAHSLGIRHNPPIDIRYYECYRDLQYTNDSDATSQDVMVSIVVPAFNTPKRYLYGFVYSVVNQFYGNWELVVVNGSTKKEEKQYIDQLTNIDTRIKVVEANEDKSIVSNTNVGIEAATGDYIAFMDHDDVLHRAALQQVVKTIKATNADLVYTDEDKLTEDGAWRHQPHFKPDWSPHLLENVNYITHFVVARASMVKKLTLRSGFDGAQDYDFLLRFTDQKDINVRHVPEILYHWREANGSTAQDFSVKPQVISAGERALMDHFVRTEKPVKKVYGINDRPGFYRAVYEKNGYEDVAVVVDKTAISSESSDLITQYSDQLGATVMNITEVGSKKHSANYYIFITKNCIPRKLDDMKVLVGAVKANTTSIIAPQILDGGHIWANTYVSVSNRHKKLFEGYHKNSTTQFGSVEWIRDVNGLSLAVVACHEGRVHEVAEAFNQAKPLFGHHLILWSHARFIRQHKKYATHDRQSSGSDYGNPNLTISHEILGVDHEEV